MCSDGYITLPTVDYLRRLCSAIDTDIVSLTETAMAHLGARFSKLSEKDKLVSIFMDEVYKQKSIQYVDGKFYGEENGKVNKTMCVMLKSIASKYRDIICTTPIGAIIEQIWKNVV